MGWNYRVFRHTDPDGVGTYVIHEAHYRDGKATSWTERGATATGDTPDELFAVLAMMIDALDHPVLDAGDGSEVEPAKLLTDQLRQFVLTAGSEHFEFTDDGLVRRKTQGPAPVDVELAREVRRVNEPLPSMSASPSTGQGEG